MEWNTEHAKGRIQGHGTPHGIVYITHGIPACWLAGPVTGGTKWVAISCMGWVLLGALLLV